MKQISAGLDAHLGQEVTTVCTCWRIERLDGTILGFTDLDMDIDYNGITYESQHGYNRTAIVSDDSMAVANLEINGILSSDQITDQDLRNGLFDFASVFVFMLNWSDLTQNELKLRRGWFGEVQLLQNGMFHTELRGLGQALNFNFIEVFSPECRADFCDARCKLKIADFTNRGTVSASTSRRQFAAKGLPNNTSPTSVGACNDWRILIDFTPQDDSTGFSEFVCWDQDGNLITGGSMSASSSLKHHGAKNGRDSNGGSYWQSLPINTNSTTGDKTKDGESPIGSWWAVHFDTPVDIKEFALVAPQQYTLAPTSFLLQYSNNGGVGWSDAQAVDIVWDTPGQSAMFGILSDGTPLNTGVGLPTVPAPYTGASTYIGGIIRFTSGFNIGRTIEIIGYNDSTGVVTMFDGAAYPIVVGDTFEIAQGCNKLFATCKLYNNAVNFRGEPHVPGQDEFLKYPDA